MKRPRSAFLLLVCALLIPSLAAAAQIRVYVAEFSVTPPDAGSLKRSLQSLLLSRMASGMITPVTAASEADVVITGSYTRLGKVFSLDAVARFGSGRTLGTAFEQGESQDDVIPALGKISATLKAEIQQGYPQTPAAAPAALPQEDPLQAAGRQGKTVWLSKRIDNAQISLAPAMTHAEGREFFVAETNSLRLYRQEKTLKLLAEVEFPLREKVIAIDSVGPDKNGNPRVYVTVMDGGAPASKIFSFENAKLKAVATGLPYLFRAIAMNGGKSRIYAQQMGLSKDFFGDLYEISDNDAKIELKNPIKLPRYANLFNYNRVNGTDGKSYAIVLNTDGYLVIYSDAGKMLWRSAEKYGGSETSIHREGGSNMKETEEKLRLRFIDQRITVTQNGEIIIPQNSGAFVVGDNRSYSKYALISFSWDGLTLEERWRSKESQNYLADYYFDADAHEVVLLEVVQKEGFFTNGGSAIRVIRAE